MSLTLELSSVQESELRTAASSLEGMPVSDYAHRLFITALHERAASQEKVAVSGRSDAEPAWKTRLRASQSRVEQARLASGITEEDIEADINAAIKSFRQERAASEHNP
ncbi:MAG: hypothetical protein H7145_00585 [Akkermansiaceae bacterium]|nr:hypothetical protein [Armatimonadota bacterium]